ncbi:MAG: DNA-processing protein DprA, partial [Eubacterium sp.]|nr:DNA-processing protein DprA [Eubacterium sp.]
MTEYDKDYYWYWFVNIKGIGNLNRVKLMERFGHPQYLYDCNPRDLSDLLSESQIASFKQSRDYVQTDSAMRRLKEENIRFIHWDSPDYPYRFRTLYDPPYGFYLKGNLPDPKRPAIAIVGSRRPSQYGRKTAAMFARELAAGGFVIVSGMASGIDSQAHRAALEVSGQTLGILGGGIDTMYPKDNWDLYLDMYEQGGILSEYNMGTVNRSGLFPVRNRLISGISDCVLVVEAREKSGSLITADQGMEQGKEVYAVPGRITDILSKGCNHLIAQGAMIAESAQEILYDIRNLYIKIRGLDLSWDDSHSPGRNIEPR